MNMLTHTQMQGVPPEEQARRAILKYVRGAKRIVTTNEVAEATALSSTCCIRVLKAYAALGEVVSHGQDSPRRPMKWGVA